MSVQTPHEADFIDPFHAAPSQYYQIYRADGSTDRLDAKLIGVSTDLTYVDTTIETLGTYTYFIAGIKQDYNQTMYSTFTIIVDQFEEKISNTVTETSENTVNNTVINTITEPGSTETIDNKVTLTPPKETITVNTGGPSINTGLTWAELMFLITLTVLIAVPSTYFYNQRM